jgi:hypothetical protein
MIRIEMKNTILSITLAAAVSLLAACGGGGGTGVTKDNPPVAQANQIRAMKGFDVTVTPFVILGTANNQPSTVEIRVTKPELIDSLAASSGVNYESPSNLPLALTLVSPGVWRLDWPKQAPIDSGLLLKFTLKTGDVLETGVEDFRFK